MPQDKGSYLSYLPFTPFENGRKTFLRPITCHNGFFGGILRCYGCFSVTSGHPVCIQSIHIDCRPFSVELDSV